MAGLLPRFIGRGRVLGYDPGCTTTASTGLQPTPSRAGSSVISNYSVERLEVKPLGQPFEGRRPAKVMASLIRVQPSVPLSSSRCGGRLSLHFTLHIGNLITDQFLNVFFFTLPRSRLLAWQVVGCLSKVQQLFFPQHRFYMS
jgi:hypothetical protein